MHVLYCTFVFSNVNAGSDFFLEKLRDVLPLISLGIEFQRNAPSYIKLFFILFVRGFGK